LQALARKLTRDPTEAQDILQDAFERAILTRDDVEADRLVCWLVTVIRHLAIDRERRRRCRQRVLATYAEDLASSSDRAEEAAPWSTLTPEDLAAAVGKLEAPFREVFTLYARDTSLSQMAVVLGVPVSTAGTRLHRAKRKLRALLSGTLQSLQSTSESNRGDQVDELLVGRLAVERALAE
jgi:RNA polymerase sigma-70 factor (ECF subfamily)